MIGYLKGTVIFGDEKSAVVNVAGVGYKVFLPIKEALRLAEKMGEEIALWTHLSVRENALDLFGFEEREDLRIFELLITVSGIGPRSALSILNSVDRETLISAIAAKETGYLTKVSGIGRKTAEKIIMELEGKVSSEGKRSHLTGGEDALEALKSLGYGEREARDALREISKETGTTSDRIREALKILGGNGK